MDSHAEEPWFTDEPPNFNCYGFHTGKMVRFRLSDGREIEDIYQGWGIFGAGNGYDWMGGDPHVTGWRPT